VKQRLWRGVEGPRRAYFTHAARIFNHRAPGWRRAKKLNLIRTINPEFNDLAQIWEWKLITAHEKMYP
jgi:hypothetical protein